MTDKQKLAAEILKSSIAPLSALANDTNGVDSVMKRKSIGRLRDGLNAILLMESTYDMTPDGEKITSVEDMEVALSNIKGQPVRYGQQTIPKRLQ